MLRIGGKDKENMASVEQPSLSLFPHFNISEVTHYIYGASSTPLVAEGVIEDSAQSFSGLEKWRLTQMHFTGIACWVHTPG